VFLRELISSQTYDNSKAKLALTLGKTINGEPVIADLAKMPHLLVAGTTGSGKSVAINTMILSILYKMTPEECRLIMIDPKMLELSVYDGIPHLLTPVVTDPKKAVVALKWTVREMEQRYKNMSKLGVRNIDGFNAKVREAAKGDQITRTVQTGFDRETGEAIYETESARSRADALYHRDHRRDGRPDDGRRQGYRGRGAAARADGARCRHPCHHGDAAPVGRRHHRHDQGELPDPHLLPGDLEDRQPHHSRRTGRRTAARHGRHALHGRRRAHPARARAVRQSDLEVEDVVNHLKLQGVPEYLEAITEDDDEDGGFDRRWRRQGGSMEDSDDPYDQAVAVVLRDGKASTSYIQRRLGIGYNRAASLIERMEDEGVIGPANHAGKREILVPTEDEMAAASGLVAFPGGARGADSAQLVADHFRFGEDHDR
jgi:S-DNA-T family DNA segregation ATPase FtsK/SpoIIIE